MTELKRCPFCGEVPEKMHGSYSTWVKCKNSECQNTGTQTVNRWQTRPIEDELNARIAQLTAERDEWKADAERLEKHHLSITKANLFHCSYCGYITKDDDGIMVHQDTCPITLHRQLEDKYKQERQNESR